MLVPGDVIVLSAGDMIPADCRVLSRAGSVHEPGGDDRRIAAGGEVRSAARTEHATNPLELDNILFMGTNVVSGSATAVVVATGNHTYFGALAQRVTATDRAPTQFQAGVNRWPGC